jgi:nitrous oxide reductase
VTPLQAAAHRVVDGARDIPNDAGSVSVPRAAYEALRAAIDAETRAPLWRVLSSPAHPENEGNVKP